MVTDHILGRGPCSGAHMHVERKFSVRYHFTVPWTHIRAYSDTASPWTRRSPLDVGRLGRTQKRDEDNGRPGALVDGQRKKVESPYLRAAGGSWLLENRGNPATLRMVERSDTFRWMRVLQRYRLRYGTFAHFTLIAKYGISASVQKKGGKRDIQKRIRPRTENAGQRSLMFFFFNLLVPGAVHLGMKRIAFLFTRNKSMGNSIISKYDHLM